MNRESGATMIIVAGAMVMLVGMAALVIDGGFAFSERRQAQTAADFAALAALQFARSCDDIDHTCDAGIADDLEAAAENGTQTAIDIVSANLRGRTLDWASCIDLDRLTYPASPEVTECVSFSTEGEPEAGTPHFTRARVVLPPDTFGTFFARALGIGDLTVTAEAAAEQSINESVDVVPLLLDDGEYGEGPGEVCVFTVLEEDVSDCDGSTDEDFAYVNLATYGNPDLGTGVDCNGAAFESNIRRGADHILGIYETESPEETPVVGDHVACPNRSENVNSLVRNQDDSPTAAVTNGLLSGSLARLGCDSGDCQNVAGRSLDNRPLWSYLTSACSGTDTHTEMESCLANQSPEFSSNLADNRRFVAVPELSINDTGDWVIDRFVPIWLESIYMDCDPTAETCGTIFTPGYDDDEDDCPVATPPDTIDSLNCGWGDGSNRVHQLTAFRLDPSMLQAVIRDNFPGTRGNREFALASTG